MNAETCPLCSSTLVQHTVAPCMICGHQQEELQHLQEGRHTYAEYCIFWPLSLVLCDYCQEHFDFFNPEWFGLPRTADIEPDRVTLVRALIPPFSPAFERVWQQCSGDGRFLECHPHFSIPDKYLCPGLWYALESSNRLRMQPNKRADFWHRDFFLRGDNLTLLTTKLRFFCKRATLEEAPEGVAQIATEKLAETWERLPLKEKN